MNYNNLDFVHKIAQVALLILKGSEPYIYYTYWFKLQIMYWSTGPMQLYTNLENTLKYVSWAIIEKFYINNNYFLASW